MTTKNIGYTTAGNHWWWRAKNELDCQIGSLVVMPEQGKLVQLSLKVAGLTYDDPVYGYQNEVGYCRAAVWNEKTGAVLTYSSYRTVDRSPGGTQPWEDFGLAPLIVPAGTRLIVGLWRKSDSTAVSTQFDYNDGASGQVLYRQHIINSASGPFTFRASEVEYGTSINYQLSYETGGKVKVWDGYNWVPRETYVWNGTAWAKGVVKVWTGSAWVEANG